MKLVVGGTSVLQPLNAVDRRSHGLSLGCREVMAGGTGVVEHGGLIWLRVVHNGLVDGETYVGKPAVLTINIINH